VTARGIAETRIAMIGMGAANVSAYRLLKTCGVNPAVVMACDSKGLLHRGRGDIAAQAQRFAEKWAVCTETNPEGRTGGIAEALKGADACIAFSRPGPGVIRPEWIKRMAKDSIVFACANPVPEIWPEAAHAAGARIVATGRSDFPNQLNNSLVFPAIFRGTLDAEASAMSDEMALAAAHELARCAEDQGLREDHILPGMADWQAVPRIAAAVALEAQELGLSKLVFSREHYIECAATRIAHASAAAASACAPTAREPEQAPRHDLH
ncbi:MAG: malate dehydrogenase, partial [Betaproteobacteria bacterium]|nr:malate dehydrogenase [Betaproteobacteria bacterium]